MAVDNSQASGGLSAGLPEVVPFSLSHLTRQSWELGRRSVTDDEATVLGRWKHDSERWYLSAFAVTSDTAILCLRTPLGRERFYGAMQSELQTALSALDAADAWQQSDLETLPF